MTEFIDSTGQSWTVAIDGIYLAELKERGIDLVQDGLYFCETREDALTKALLVLCREQITALRLTDRQFAQRLAGEVTDKAIDAVRGAAQLFFRPSKWSEIQSLCSANREASQSSQEIQRAWSQLPESIRETISVADMMRIMSSQTLETSPSASGQDANPPNTAGDSPGSSGSIREA